MKKCVIYVKSKTEPPPPQINQCVNVYYSIFMYVDMHIAAAISYAIMMLSGLMLKSHPLKQGLQILLKQNILHSLTESWGTPQNRVK